MPTEPPTKYQGDTLRPEVPEHAQEKLDADHPGYETQDVNVRGIVVFLGGLAGSLAVFFFLCFFIGKLINSGFVAQDGDVDKWHANHSLVGDDVRGTKREDLVSNPEMQQRELNQIANSFPLPRVPTDDDNQELADLHAREDLMLNYYSTAPDMSGGKIRIPISRAMQLVEQQGLGAQSSAADVPAPKLMYGDKQEVVTMPLTTGFARTGYELQTIETREQKLDYEKAKTHE
jgi:hypothetical protein